MARPKAASRSGWAPGISAKRKLKAWALNMAICKPCLRATIRKCCAMATTVSRAKRYSSFRILAWDCGLPAENCWGAKHDCRFDGSERDRQDDYWQVARPAAWMEVRSSRGLSLRR